VTQPRHPHALLDQLRPAQVSPGGQKLGQHDALAAGLHARLGSSQARPPRRPHGRSTIERLREVGARSNVFQEFGGGPCQIALHGLANIGGVLGSAASHGCVCLDNGTMRWLVFRIGPGVPVTITS